MKNPSRQPPAVSRATRRTPSDAVKNLRKHGSRILTKSISMAPAWSLVKAAGVWKSFAERKRPIVTVVNSFTTQIPGHAHLRTLEDVAVRELKRLGFSEDQTQEMCFLIRNQSLEIASDRRSLKLKLREMPPERLKLLLQFKYADLRAKSPEFEGAAMLCKRQVDAINEIVAMKECYTLQQLAVNRYDLMQKGMVKSDEQARAILEKLLDMVIDAPAFNTRPRLMNAAEKLLGNTKQI